MKTQIKSVVSLTVICAVIAVLLAVTNMLTAPTIADNLRKEAEKALTEVLPDGTNFTEVDLTRYEQLPDSIEKIHKAENGGYVFQINATGNASGMVLMIGVNPDGTVAGGKCIASKEDYKAEYTYGDAVKGATLDTIDSVDTVSGVTKTTKGYRDAVKEVLRAFVLLSGGDVQFGSPEEIFHQNLASALPAAEGAFTELVLTEKLDNVASAWEADNGTGYVFVTGETFVALDANGVAVAGTDPTVASHVEAQAAILFASTLTPTDLTDLYASGAVHSDVLSASVTASGNYVFEMRASGYSKSNKYAPAEARHYIYFTVAISGEGEILSCITTSQHETEGYGAVCGEHTFFNQFNGLGDGEYTDIVITGPTAKITMDGYHKALERAFNAVIALKGDA